MIKTLDVIESRKIVRMLKAHKMRTSRLAYMEPNTSTGLGKGGFLMEIQFR
jgi:hypothetical protein